MLIKDKAINQALSIALDQTKHSLKISMYSISANSKRSCLEFNQFWKSLENAIKRLPSTQIILCGWPESNPQHHATLKAAMLLRLWGADVKIANEAIILHAKAWIFDGQRLLIGSHNATEAGFTRTKNVSILTFDELACQEFTEYFNYWWTAIDRQDNKQAA